MYVSTEAGCETDSIAKAWVWLWASLAATIFFLPLKNLNYDWICCSEPCGLLTKTPALNKCPLYKTEKLNTSLFREMAASLDKPSLALPVKANLAPQQKR